MANEEQVRRMELALRNCLAMAGRMLRKGGVDADPAWEHVVRFCKEAGVEPNILRESTTPTMCMCHPGRPMAGCPNPRCQS